MNRSRYTKPIAYGLDSNSAEKPRAVIIILESMEEKQIQLKKEPVVGIARILFSPELQPSRTIEISGPQRRAEAPQRPRRKGPGHQERNHNSENILPKEFSLAHTRYGDGKVSENSAEQFLL